MKRPTIEENGFFEGVYDYHVQLSYHAHLRKELTPAEVPYHHPYLGGWDDLRAQPAILGFHSGVEQHLGKLSLPYRQTNQLVQIGLQYNREPENRRPVPDGYMVRYSRLGRFAYADINKYLSVAILRDKVSQELAESDTSIGSDTHRYWQQIAQKGARFGNAVLAFSTYSISYKPLFGELTKKKYVPPEPADRALAEAVFETVVYWE